MKEETVRAKLKAKQWAPYSKADQALDEAALLATGDFSSVRFEEIALSSSAVRLDVELTEATLPVVISTPAVATPYVSAASTAAANPEPSTAAVAGASAVLSSAPVQLPGWGPKPATGSRRATGEFVPPWVIGDIALVGNHNVKLSTIRSQIKARKGDIYEKTDLERDIQSLLSMGDFERVTADIAPMPEKPVPPHLLGVAGSTSSARLTFTVSEKPLVGKIRFEGAKKVSKSKLSDAATLKEKDPLDRAKMNEDVRKMLDVYREKGYLQAAIDPAVAVDTRAMQAAITYKIAEGPRTTIAEVVIDGVHAFKPKKIAKQMETNRRKKVLDENKMQDDIKGIEAYYKNNGYSDVKISSYVITYTTAPGQMLAHIRMNVDEGRQYRFGVTTFSGFEVIASTALTKAVDYRRGKIFSQEKFETTIRNIQELYADTGRLRTRVTPQKTYNPTTSETDVNFDITEGHVSYVDHIDVEGNHATKTHVLRREVVLKPGQPFSAAKIRKSQEKLMNLGFLEDVQLDVQSPTDPDKVDVTFDVTEGKPGMLTAGAGFSSLDGLIGTLSVQHMNLFGRAQRVSVQWQFGQRVQDYSLSWTTPWLAESPTSLGVDLFNTRRISPFQSSFSGFVDKRTGGTVRLGPRFQDDQYLLNFAYTFQKVTVSNVQDQFNTLLPSGTSVQSSLSAELARDTRDNIWDPTRGTRNSIGMALSGGPLFGDVSIAKPFVADAVHFHLTDIQEYPLVLSFSNRGSYVTPFGHTKEVPVFEKFFLGGQDTLRGYAPNGEVGPSGGGTAYDVFNTELGFPLARERRKTIVKIVGFFDAGAAWQDAHATHFRVGTGESDVRTDVGFGIRFTTPAFPIRLDWGYGLNHKPGERRYQINFGIGSLF